MDYIKRKTQMSVLLMYFWRRARRRWSFWYRLRRVRRRDGEQRRFHRGQQMILRHTQLPSQQSQLFFHRFRRGRLVFSDFDDFEIIVFHERHGNCEKKKFSQHQVTSLKILWKSYVQTRTMSCYCCRWKAISIEKLDKEKRQLNVFL